MCEGPRKPISSPLPSTDSMKPVCSNPSLLLVFAATDDLPAIKRAVEVDREDPAASAPWYSRLFSGKMGFADRTPLMIAALYGSVRVLDYLLRSAPQKINPNHRSDSDGGTALHLAAAGGSSASLDAVKILIDAGADVDSVDNSGRRPGDLIAKQTARSLEGILKAISSRSSSPVPAASDERKKEYPADLTLPDIKNGIYSTDEFRMYSFKVKPCSRAYSHDWTECPFVHPGENARRRDPRKYLYSCVPCPDFRKGSCHHGDSCEYAHGVFECWLHPAQYRTRLCKDVDGCNRRVCFFAHKEEELRSVNPTMASVNGIVPPPSPRSSGFSNLEMAAAAALLLSSPSPMSPSAVSAAMGSPGTMWSNNQAPTLQLPSSRLKASMCARDLDADFDLVGLESYQQKLLDEYQAAVGSPRTANYRSDLYGPQMISSPTLNSSSSSASFGGLDHSMAKAIMNSRQAAFAKRSQSFVDRGAAARMPGSGFSSPQPVTSAMGLSSDWGSPDRKVDWGMERDELSMLRKSASFAYRSNQPISPPKRAAPPPAADEPDFSWVHSLVRDGPTAAGGQKMNGGADMFSPWGEEQLVA